VLALEDEDQGAEAEEGLEEEVEERGVVQVGAGSAAPVHCDQDSTGT